MKTFKEVKEFLANIDSIHYGGCGIAALSMCRWLEKNDPKKLKDILVVYGNDDEDIHEDNEQCLENGETKYIHATSHAYLMDVKDGQRFDCEGHVCNYEYDHEMTFKHNNPFLINSINLGGWNHCFDREENVPYIEKKLQINLQDIEL